MGSVLAMRRTFRGARPIAAVPVQQDGVDLETYILQRLRYWRDLLATLRHRDSQRTRDLAKSVMGLADLAGVVYATGERQHHDPVEVLEQTIADDEGTISRPSQVVDWLERMRRRGDVSEEQAKAGTRFRDDFRLSQFDMLRAADAARIPGNGKAPGISFNAILAGSRAWRALQALGGQGSPAGSAAWFTLGLEMSIKDWAVRCQWGNGRSMAPERASGVVIGMLCALEAHYSEEDGFA